MGETLDLLSELAHGNTKHGFSQNSSPLYAVWKRMRQRFSLDRKNNNKGYSQANCRWATATDQQRNRRFVRITKEKADQLLAEYSPRTFGERGRVAAKYGISLRAVGHIVERNQWL